MAEKPKKKVVKQTENAVLYDDGTILVKNVRLSYPHLDKPYAGKGKDQGEPKFGVVGLAPKATHKDVMLMCRDEIRRLLAENKIKDIAADKKFIRDGDLTGKEENEGQWIISAREKNAPILRDQRNKTVQAVDASRIFYGGCYGNILIRPWWQSNDFGKRVNANLLAVQFARDGEPFGEGRISEDDADEVFGEVDDDESGFDEDEEDDEL